MMRETINFGAPIGWHSQTKRVKVYVDLENACGGSLLVRDYEKSIRRSILDIRQCCTTQVTYSVGPTAITSCPELIWDWGFARFLPGRGIDGADLALLAAIQNEPFRVSFDSLVLVSGDHIFADEISRLNSIGVSTTVISHKLSLSSQLRKAATKVQYLPEFKSPITERRTA